MKIVQLPDLPKKGDMSDWVQGKDTQSASEQLAILVGNAPELINPENEAAFIESLPVFIKRVSLQPNPKALLNELVFEDTIGLSHGQPRDGKTLAELEMMLAASIGTCAFGSVFGLRTNSCWFLHRRRFRTMDA